MVNGPLQVLRKRLAKDDTRGEFTGDLQNAHTEYLKDGCALLSINSKGSRVIQVLRDRLARDDTRGPFTGDLTTAHLNYLKDDCYLLSINSNGTREEVLERIHFYNSRKR